MKELARRHAYGGPGTRIGGIPWSKWVVNGQNLWELFCRLTNVPSSFLRCKDTSDVRTPPMKGHLR